MKDTKWLNYNDVKSGRVYVTVDDVIERFYGITRQQFLSKFSDLYLTFPPVKSIAKIYMSYHSS